MRVEIIYPSDFIGGDEVQYTFDSLATNVTGALDEVLAILQDSTDAGWPAHNKLRPMCMGDIIIIGEQHYIVGPAGSRAISAASAQQWRRRTLVERMIGSGEYARVAGQSGRLTKVL